MDYASAWIGLDQYRRALAGLAEKASVRLAVLRDADMTPCHAGIDPIGVLPIGGDITRPVRGLIFDCSFGSRHPLRGFRWLMFGRWRIREHQHRNANCQDTTEPCGSSSECGL